MVLKRQLPLWWLSGITLLVCFLSFTGEGLAKTLVDLNTASSQELDTLKGVGPATAKKIIEHRPYSSVNDLSQAGLSAKEIETLKPLVTVSAAKTAGPAAAVTEKSTKPAESDGLIDLNSASQRELESLPGIGKISADKIIAGRPYTTLNDLKKAGISEKNIAAIKSLVTINPPRQAAATPPKAAGSKLIDLNTATQAELESLPEIGKSTARKIIASRPFASVDELSKADLNSKTIAKLKPLVTVSTAPSRAAAGTSGAAGPAATAAPTAKKGEATAKAASPAAKLNPGEKVNINTASKEKLDALPEIGPVKAQAIIDNRPYKKLEDIMKVKGIKEATYNKIKEMITVD